jgi:hypothetical protein
MFWFAAIVTQHGHVPKHMYCSAAMDGFDAWDLTGIWSSCSILHSYALSTKGDIPPYVINYLRLPQPRASGTHEKLISYPLSLFWQYLWTTYTMSRAGS